MQYFGNIIQKLKNIFNTRFAILLMSFLLILYIVSVSYNINHVYKQDDILKMAITSHIQPEPMQSRVSKEYINTKLKDTNERMFPFRYFQDENGNMLPIVAVTGFFRDKKAKDLYFDYIKNGVIVIGITAYKSFPKKITDGSDDPFHLTDDFDYTKNIKDWLCCFKDPNEYGFTSGNNLIDISESDLYDVSTDPDIPKKYDFIYVCIKDNDQCPMDGWNAINRNFKLAKDCFPVLMNEFNLKGLIVGRVGCGLEQQFGDRVEVTDWLSWHELQEKMKLSRFLFVPNVYDASPRVIAECITKGLSVLMNRSILCGSKYVTSETGELFTDEKDIGVATASLLNKIDHTNPKKWWSENYGITRTAEKIRDFLYPTCPDVLGDVSQVKFS